MISPKNPIAIKAILPASFKCKDSFFIRVNFTMNNLKDQSLSEYEQRKFGKG